MKAFFDRSRLNRERGATVCTSHALFVTAPRTRHTCVYMYRIFAQLVMYRREEETITCFFYTTKKT